MAIADYLNRTIDLLFLDDFVEERGDVLLQQRLAAPGKSGEIITGIQKLAQRFILELLTRQGTLNYLPQRGTSFMTDALRGYWRTVADVEQSFYGALLQLEANLIREEDTADSKDEKYAGAELQAVSFQQDRVSLRVRLRSQAGNARTYIYPLSIYSKEN